MLAVARAMADLEWSGTPFRCNTYDEFRAKAKYPLYIHTAGPGPNTGMPYDWGGQDDIATFESKLAKRLSAGSRAPNNEPRTWSCTTGVDCSGLVSLSWGLRPGHHDLYTGTLPSIATEVKPRQLPKFGDLSAGDIIIGKRHVVLVENANTNGIQIYEASAGKQKVIHRSLTYNDPIVLYGKAYRYICVAKEDGSLVVPNPACAPGSPALHDNVGPPKPVAPLPLNQIQRPGSGHNAQAMHACISADPSVDFGVDQVGETKQLHVNVKNCGSADIEQAQISVEGATASVFGVSPTEKLRLPAGSAASIPLDVSFTPEAEGDFLASLKVIGMDAASSATISLHGVGRQPCLVIDSSPVVDFKRQNIGFASPPSMVVIRNCGVGTIHGLQMRLTGTNGPAFSLNAPSAHDLIQGSNIAVNIVFMPPETGRMEAVFEASAERNVVSKPISLQGYGIAPKEELSPSGSIDFGFTRSAKETRLKTLSIRNVGDAPLNVNDARLEDNSVGVFKIISSLDNRPLDPGEQRNVVIVFRARKHGAYHSKLVLFGNYGGLRIVELIGEHRRHRLIWFF
jgi:hypothetical protein